jgi:hypothetical protein
MQAAIGAKPFVVRGVRDVAGAVIPKAAVAATATTATESCFRTFAFKEEDPPKEPLFPLRVMDTTLSHRSPSATNAVPTDGQSMGHSVGRTVPGTHLTFRRHA